MAEDPDGDRASRRSRGGPLRERPGHAVEPLMRYGLDLLEPYTTELTHQGCREFLGLVVASHPEVIGPWAIDGASRGRECRSRRTTSAASARTARARQGCQQTA